MNEKFTYKKRLEYLLWCARKERFLSGSHFRILMFLALEADDEGTIYTTQRLVGLAVNLSSRTVTTKMRTLKKLGMLRSLSVGGGQYHLPYTQMKD